MTARGGHFELVEKHGEAYVVYKDPDVFFIDSLVPVADQQLAIGKSANQNKRSFLDRLEMTQRAVIWQINKIQPYLLLLSTFPELTEEMFRLNHIQYWYYFESVPKHQSIK